MSNRKQKKQAVLAKRVAGVKLYKKRCQVKVDAVTVSALSFQRVVHRSMKAYREAATTDDVLGSLNNLTTHLNEQLEGYATGPDGVKVDLRDLDVGALLLTSCLSEEEQANQAALQKLSSKHLLESRELSQTDGYKFLHDEDVIPLPEFMSGIAGLLDGGFKRGDFTTISAKTSGYGYGGLLKSSAMESVSYEEQYIVPQSVADSLVANPPKALPPVVLNIVPDSPTSDTAPLALYGDHDRFNRFPDLEIIMSDEAIAQRWDPSKPNEDTKGS